MKNYNKGLILIHKCSQKEREKREKFSLFSILLFAMSYSMTVDCHLFFGCAIKMYEERVKATGRMPRYTTRRQTPFVFVKNSWSHYESNQSRVGIILAMLSPARHFFACRYIGQRPITNIFWFITVCRANNQVTTGSIVRTKMQRTRREQAVILLHGFPQKKTKRKALALVYVESIYVKVTCWSRMASKVYFGISVV